MALLLSPIPIKKAKNNLMTSAIHPQNPMEPIPFRVEAVRQELADCFTLILSDMSLASKDINFHFTGPVQYALCLRPWRGADLHER